MGLISTAHIQMHYSQIINEHPASPRSKAANVCVSVKPTNNKHYVAEAKLPSWHRDAQDTIFSFIPPGASSVFVRAGVVAFGNMVHSHPGAHGRIHNVNSANSPIRRAKFTIFCNVAIASVRAMSVHTAQLWLTFFDHHTHTEPPTHSRTKERCARASHVRVCVSYLEAINQADAWLRVGCEDEFSACAGVRFVPMFAGVRNIRAEGASRRRCFFCSAVFTGAECCMLYVCVSISFDIGATGAHAEKNKKYIRASKGWFLGC